VLGGTGRRAEGSGDCGRTAEASRTEERRRGREGVNHGGRIEVEGERGRIWWL
jgi:hypothetical protein